MAIDSGAYAFQLPQGSPSRAAQNQASRTVAEAAQQPSAKDMDLIAPTKGLLQTGVDGEEAYYTEWQNMNNFATEMFVNYGIDVTKPDPNMPGAMDAYRQFNRLYATAKQRGQQLRAGYEQQEAINQAYLRGDIMMPSALRDGRMTTTQDALSTLPAKIDDPVTNFNNMMRNTAIVTQNDLAEAQNIRQGLVDYYQQDMRQHFLDMNIPQEDVDMWVDRQVNALQSPSMDMYKAQDLALRRQRLDVDRAKAEGEEPSAVERYSYLNNIIEKATKGEKAPELGAILSAAYGPDKLTGYDLKLKKVPDYSQSYTGRTMKERPTLIIYTVYEPQGKEVFLDTPDAVLFLNNMMNAAPGQTKVPLEDIARFVEGSATYQQGGVQTQQQQTQGQVIEITTQEEYNQLQPGQAYIWNGQQYTKE